MLFADPPCGDDFAGAERQRWASWALGLLAVGSAARDPAKGFVTVRRIEPHAAKPRLRHAVVEGGVVAFRHVPRTANRCARVEVEFAKGADDVGRGQPFVLGGGRQRRVEGAGHGGALSLSPGAGAEARFPVPATAPLAPRALLLSSGRRFPG